MKFIIFCIGRRFSHVVDLIGESEFKARTISVESKC